MCVALSGSTSGFGRTGVNTRTGITYIYMCIGVSGVDFITLANSGGQVCESLGSCICSGGNVIILASNAMIAPNSKGSLVGGAVRYNGVVTSRIEADPRVLTDNYAPVEQLQTR